MGKYHIAEQCLEEKNKNYIIKEVVMYNLYFGSCFDILEKIKDDSVDTVICDPPYNIKISEWDKNFDIEKLSYFLSKKTKENSNIIIFQGYSNVCETKSILDRYFIMQDWIIYDRIKGRGATKHLVSTREDILWYTKGKNYTFNKIYSNIKKKTKGFGIKNGSEFRALSNVWTDISPIVPWSKEKTIHPSQKPEMLIDRCVKIWTNENDIVLDPTMGSGTTGVCCLKNKRNFIGIENKKEYFDIAKNRIENI